MKLTDEEKKLLRRVCARFHTGIRKPFTVNGQSLSLILEPVMFTTTLLRFNDVQDRYNCEILTEVTPDSIVTAIDLFEVRQVMES